MPREPMPWRVRRYPDEGPLTEAQIDQLNQRFAIDRARLVKLSSDLARALNPSRTYSARGAKGVWEQAERAKQALSEAIKYLEASHSKKKKALQSLDQMRVSFRDEPQGPEDSFQVLKREIEDSVRQNAAWLDLLKQIENGAADADLHGKPDKRLVSDFRREMVSAAVFSVWAAAGRQLSTPNDAVAGKRSGNLVLFAQDVVYMLTEPPNQVSGETIRSDLKDYKEMRYWSDVAEKVLKDQDVSR